MLPQIGSTSNAASLSSSAAALASFLTYNLGKSLYIPLTSRCNARTSPETRGDNFHLPLGVVTSLCRFRDYEHSKEQWEYWCRYLDTQGDPDTTPMKLPKAHPERIADHLDELLLYDNSNESSSESLRKPTSSEIVEAVQLRLEQDAVSNAENPENRISSLVFAGEGEPLLRWNTMLEVAQELTNISTSASSSTSNAPLPMRLVTNGLFRIPSTSYVQDMLDVGISDVSIALMTSDPKQYQELMDPLLDGQDQGDERAPDPNAGDAHSRVCRFIADCCVGGNNSTSADSQNRRRMEVEVTGVDRPEVNKVDAQALAVMLGVTKPMRWRSYNP